jgi:hypothetical protein
MLKLQVTRGKVRLFISKLELDSSIYSSWETLKHSNGTLVYCHNMHSL